MLVASFQILWALVKLAMTYAALVAFLCVTYIFIMVAFEAMAGRPAHLLQDGAEQDDGNRWDNW